MSVLNYAGRLFSLNTLDTRFTTSSRRSAALDNKKTQIDPAKPNAESSDSRGRTKPIAEASPSRWGTMEFFVYYLVFIIVVPMMFYVGYEVSKRKCLIASLDTRHFLLIFQVKLMSHSFTSKLSQI